MSGHGNGQRMVGIVTTQGVVLEASSLPKMLARMVRTRRVMAPVKRGRTAFAFDWIDDPAEVALGYVRTVLPPKKAILPAHESILDFSLEPTQTAAPIIDDEPFVLFGVHPCDMSGITQLDWAFSRNVKDPHYLARREAATIVALDCMPDEYCFCTSVGTAGTRDGADLFLTPIGTGFMVDVLTPKGAALLEEAPALREPSAEELAEAEAWPEEKARCITRRIDGDIADLPDILERRYESDVWNSTAERCYSCGTCTIVCPTCFCFDVRDEVNLPLTGGSRGRHWDSCQFLDFALVAGPHNFRGKRGSRVRHRWLRKFEYLHREYGRPFCTGCGRCTQACTADISLTDVLNEIIAEVNVGVT